MLIETPSSSSSDGDGDDKKLISVEKRRPNVKIQRKCLRTQSTSELPQLNNGGLTKGLRKVHSSSNFYRITAMEDLSTVVKKHSNHCKKLIEAYIF